MDRYSVLLLFLFAGCMVPNTGESPQSAITVMDDLGRTVTLGEYPERIVSAAPSNTEILFALGLGDRVVGVTEYCDYPPEASGKEKIGGFSTVDIERVMALEPDLVLASTQTGDENIQKLEDLGIPVAVLHPADVKGVLDDIRLVGRLTGTEERADDLVGEMEDRIAEVQDRVLGRKKPRVFYVVWHDPLMGAGRGTFIADLMEMAGGDNVAADLEGYQTMSLEVLLERDPEVIIAGGGPDQHNSYQWVLGEKRLEGAAAVRDGRVFEMDQDTVNRGGPRIVGALEDLARLLHPEAF